MIDENVIESARDFSRYVSSAMSQFPQYQLDFGWPSVGTIDLVTFALRGLKEFNEPQTQIINGTAAYLAGLAHDVWARFPDKHNIDVKMSKTAPYDISISVRGGLKMQSKDRFVVNISDSLRKIHQNPPDPFPVFEGLSRSLHPEHNLISLFAAGLLTGLCPYGEGPWSKLAVKDWAPSIVFCERAMASSCADNYKQLFPVEELGADPELYLHQLILPPAGYEEPFPACRGAMGLLNHLKQKEKTTEQIKALTLNLALSPDELISSAGFAISVALHKEGDIFPRLSATAEAKSYYIPRVRPAIMVGRKAGELPFEWTEL